MRRILIFCLCGFLGLAGLFGGRAAAQILKPVKWSYAARRTSATTAIVFMKAKIDRGWHIYSTVQGEGGPQKTAFSFTGSRDYALIGGIVEGRPVRKFQKVFDMDVLYFEGDAVFSQKIRLRSGTKPFAVRGSVEFMVCNDRECLPPDEVSFSVPLR